MQDRIPLKIRAEGWQSSAAPLKVLADGSQIPADDPRTDHIAVLFPDGWLVSTRLTAADDGTEYDESDDAVEAVKQERLLGFHDWINAPLDEVLLRHVIRHDRHSPAVDTNLFPNFPKQGWIRSDVTPWSPASAFYVYLDDGYVYDLHRGDSGFGLACRRARQ
ncbi:hypothetical protein [Stenotrophomonas sp. PS02298]|uniref:hypothetical protein n=1 Tax=Stenotrophomonas sp. PS02298 TaxID=2991424 RepID=UPI00249B0492|nr:hypothetical protein [Stenotrophomonas sp. PS02298]